MVFNGMQVTGSVMLELVVCHTMLPLTISTKKSETKDTALYGYGLA